MCAYCLKREAFIEGYCSKCFQKAVKVSGLPAQVLAQFLREGMQLTD